MEPLCYDEENNYQRATLKATEKRIVMDALEEYQRNTVNAVGARIQDIGLAEALETLRSHSDDDLMNKVNQQRIVDISIPTGAGKALIVGTLIKEYLPEYIVLVFPPGGALQKKSAQDLENITGAAQMVTDETFNQSPQVGVTYVFSGSPLMMNQRNAKDKNGFDWLEETADKKNPLAVIIDEAHQDSRHSSDSIMPILNDIRTTLGYSPLVIVVS